MNKTLAQGVRRSVRPLLVLACLAPWLAQAAVLPEDRSDMLYHYYDGGGVRISGPAVLVRKGYGESLSFSGHYYIDNITSASIDVEMNASEYREQRDEVGVGVDYLHEDTIISFNYVNSAENDYDADTFAFSLAHEFMNGMTTLNLGVSRGFDTVGDSTDDTFAEDVDRYKYHFGVSQVITPKMVMNFDYEVITAEGFLNNPYRVAIINGVPNVPERYPDSRASQAAAVSSIVYLGNRDSLRLYYRFYSDDWDIRAHTVEAGYTHHYSKDVLAEYRLRYYTQSDASFYSDNFSGIQQYMARDKELSTFNSYSMGFKIEWDIFRHPTATFKAGKLNFSYNRFKFNYDNFSNYVTGEPYSFRANVFQFYFSLFY